MKFVLSNLIAVVVSASSPVFVTGKPSFHTTTTHAFTRSVGVAPTSTTTSCTTTTTVNEILSIRGGAVHESQTLSDLESRIQSAALQNKLTVVDFTATWCGPCKMIAPVFHELSNELGSRVQFVKVDVDENPEAAQKYGVSAMPTFLFIKGGEEVDRLMGANSERLKEVCVCVCDFTCVAAVVKPFDYSYLALTLYQLINEWSF